MEDADQVVGGSALRRTEEDAMLRTGITVIAIGAAMSLWLARPAAAQRCRYPYYGQPGQAHMGGSPVNPLVGQIAPSLQLPGLDGQDHLLSEYRGLTNKTIVLHFTDPTSEPCRAAATHLESLWKDSDKREVVVVTVVEGSGRDPIPDRKSVV